MDRHSSLLRPGKRRHFVSLVYHLFHCEFKVQCFLFVVVSLVVELSYFGQVVVIEYLSSFICLEGIGFVIYLSLFWIRIIMILAAPYTDSGLLSTVIGYTAPHLLLILSSSISDEGFGLWRL